MTKSPNKHNRIYCKGAPLEEGLANDIENGYINPDDNQKDRAKFMSEKYNWDKNDGGMRLWSFGPDNIGPNLVVD